MSDDFTALETILLDLYHQRLKQFGFPAVQDLVFQSRRYMPGLGRYTYLTHAGHTDLEAAYLDHDFLVTFVGKGTHAQVSCDVEDFKVRRLDIISLDDGLWDGTEDGWRLMDGDILLTPPYRPREVK